MASYTWTPRFSRYFTKIGSFSVGYKAPSKYDLTEKELISSNAGVNKGDFSLLEMQKLFREHSLGALTAVSALSQSLACSKVISLL
jgi:hypothetical protein